ncbi:hypothetical protein, partial [uncultured Varibaculum sp.]|uniref:hypothetical protein n=1 Tax=uncultured Varibaculum sp. TaxID=413896 RepID=UPI00259103C0
MGEEQNRERIENMEDSATKPQATPSGANPPAPTDSPATIGRNPLKSASGLPNVATKPPQNTVSPIAARSWWV